MIFRNSITSILRSKGKTVLFTLIIFALTMVLALGVSVWASVEQFLADANEFYTTIGVVEYKGTVFPNDTVFDETMYEALPSFDKSRISEDPAVLSWEDSAVAMGHVDGFWRTDTLLEERNLSVLVIGRASMNERYGTYSAIVLESLFSVQSDEDRLIYVDHEFGDLQPDRFYLVFGETYTNRATLTHFRKADFTNGTALAAGVEVPDILDITVEGEKGKTYKIPEDSIFTKVAQSLAITNNSVQVVGTADLMSLHPFHQEELYIIDGRPFTPEEYAQGARVAVIPDLMAKRAGVGIGDTIDLSVAISDQPGIYNSYWIDSGFAYHEKFTVVGIVNTVVDKSWHVYVPNTSGVPFTPFPVGYVVGQAVIKNEEIAAFTANVASAFDGRFQLTLYDQGYSTVEIPFRTILNAAKIVTGVCALMEIAVLILFGYLFVYRQRETSQNMIILGAGRMRVAAYFVYSSSLISLVAAAAGAGAAYLLYDRVITLIGQSAGNFALIDSRYSNSNLSISRVLAFAPDPGWGLFFIVGAVVFLLAVLACLLFVLGTFINDRPSQSRAAGPNRESRTSRMQGGSLKYAFLSILRGGNRTVIVPLLAFTVVIFFGQLATTTQRYEEQLNAIYDGTKIQGYYTDINGKQLGGLVLSGYDISQVYQSGYLDSLNISNSESYYYLGITKTAAGLAFEVEPLYVPTNYFEQEAIEDFMARSPHIVATNSIRTAPEFFYADDIEMRFLAGYDESFFAAPISDERSLACILPTSFMSDNGIELGDTVKFAVNMLYNNPEYRGTIFYDFELLVAGSYEKQGTADTIYAPLALFVDTSLIWGDGQAASGAPSDYVMNEMVYSPDQVSMLQYTVLHSANFSLDESRNLDDFKEYLQDYGYSQVKKLNRVRQFVVLRDSSFNSAVASTKQQIQYINMLYPVLYVLVGVLALAVSYLLVVSRRNEFAIMRGVGATRTRTFLSFFVEQFIMVLAGMIIGLAAWYLIHGTLIKNHLLLSAGFLVAYLVGSSLSIMVMNHTRVLSILMDRD